MWKVLAEAKWGDEILKSLKDFACHLIDQDFVKKSTELLETIEKFSIVLAAEKHIGGHVVKAVDMITTKASGREHPDGGLAAVILGIPQGKAMLKRAKEIADANSESNELADTLSECCSLASAWLTQSLEHHQIGRNSLRLQRKPQTRLTRFFAKARASPTQALQQMPARRSHNSFPRRAQNISSM